MATIPLLQWWRSTIFSGSHYIIFTDTLKESWSAFLKVNEIFANEVSKVYTDGDSIIIQGSILIFLLILQTITSLLYQE